MSDSKLPPVEIVDVTPKPNRGQRRRRMAFVLLGALLFAVAGWWAFENILKPSMYRQSVKEGLSILKKAPDTAKKLSRWEKLPESEQARLVALQFADYVPQASNEVRIKIARDAFALAIHLGNVHARIDYGVALESGDFGITDVAAANQEFNDLVKELKPRVARGEPRATYGYALLLSEGRGGLEENTAQAGLLLDKVYRELPVGDLESLFQGGYPYKRIVKSDPELVLAIAGRIFELGGIAPVLPVRWACDSISGKGEATEAARTHWLVDMPRWRLAMDRAKRLDADMNKCVVKALRPFAERGDEAARAEITKIEEWVVVSVEDAPSVPKKSNPKASVRKHFTPEDGAGGSKATIRQIPDPERQAHTGYLKGAPVSAQSGLSTFTVDNRNGSGDAVARIYLNGDKPAVRSLYVKVKETFTAKDLPPGTYVLRYRFIGSTDTYEADPRFQLSEETTAEGTRYSKVTVTLFTVNNGNMKTHKVDPDKF